MPEIVATNDKYHHYTEITIRIVAVLAVVIGIWQIKNAIKLPFITNNENNLNQDLFSQSLDSSNSIASNNKDTDSDGLNDADEINIYHTSPYLSDTDSDGLTDKQETDKGTDPLCPEGQTCLKPSLNTNVSISVGTTPSTSTVSPAELRAWLKQNGIKEELLNTYDDTTLLSLYQELVGSQTNSTGSDTNASTSIAPNVQQVKLTPEQKSLISKMSPDELRKFLIQGGADQTTLSKFSDEALGQLVQQLVSQ